MAAEAHVRAMGSAVRVVVGGGPTGLIARAGALIDGLEARWSRFLPDSEVTRLNEAAGRPGPASADTILLVQRRRRWATAAGDGHHVIDPTLDGPARSGVAQATVVAGSAWCAEVFATTTLIAGPTDGLRLVADAGAEGLLVTDAGTVRATAGLEPFLAPPQAA